MKKLFLVILTLLLFSGFGIISPSNAQQYKQIRLPIEKAFSINSTTQTIDKENLAVSFNEGESKIERTIIKFDTSIIPKDVVITEAKLNFEISKCDGVTANISIGRITSNWDESTINWANKPGFSSPTEVSQLDCINQLGSWDVSGLIKDYFKGNYENFGIIIYGPDESGTPPYSRNFNLNGENTFITVDFEVLEVVNNPAPESEKFEISNKQLLLILIGVIISTIFLVSVIVFLVVKKKKNAASKFTKIEEKADIIEPDEALNSEPKQITRLTQTSNEK